MAVGLQLLLLPLHLLLPLLMSVDLAEHQRLLSWICEVACACGLTVV